MDVAQQDRVVAKVADVFQLGQRGIVLVIADHSGPIHAGGRLWNGAAFVTYAGPEFIDTVSGDARLAVTVAAGDLGLVADTMSVEFASAFAAG